MKKLLLVLLFTAMGMFEGHSQALVQTYTDRCTGETKIFSVPMNGQTVVAFYDRSRVFTAAEFQDGTLQAWLEATYLYWNSMSPCSSNVTGATNTQQTTQQTTQQAAQAAEAATSATTNQTTNVPDTTSTQAPDTSAASSPPPDTSSTADTSSQPNTSGTESTASTGDSSGSGSGQDNSSSSGQSDSGSSEQSQNTEQNTTEETNNTESSQTEESSSTQEEGGSDESSSDSEQSSSDEGDNESGSDDTEETESEDVEEESKEEESTEKESEEETEEESTEEETEEEETEEESTEESEEDKPSKKKKKKRKRNLAPPIVTANALAQQLPTGEYVQAMNIGISRSSLLGDKTYGLNTMIYSNGQQFMLNGNFSKVHINKEGRVNRVYSASLGVMKSFTTVMFNMNHSFVFMGKKGGVGGIAASISHSSINVDVRDGLVFFDSQVLSTALTGFWTKPFKFDRLTISPMLAVSSPFMAMEVYDRSVNWNTDVTIIGGSNFSYTLTKRFALNIGANVIESTMPEFPTLKTFTIGGRLSF